MLNNTSQTTLTDSEILDILGCSLEDDTYSIFEVATATPNCLF